MARLDKDETRKDMIQAAVESGATHAGQIMGIVAGAVRDVTREIGDFATDVFEMREAAQRAAQDPADPGEPVDDPPPLVPDDPAAVAEPGDPAGPAPPAQNA
jgi:hypothetical protein